MIEEATSSNAVTSRSPPTRVCLSCRIAKVRCDKNQPCERCEKLNLNCQLQARGRGRPRKEEESQTGALARRIGRGEGGGGVGGGGAGAAARRGGRKGRRKVVVPEGQKEGKEEEQEEVDEEEQAEEEEEDQEEEDVEDKAIRLVLEEIWRKNEALVVDHDTPPTHRGKLVAEMIRDPIAKPLYLKAAVGMFVTTFVRLHQQEKLDGKQVKMMMRELGGRVMKRASDSSRDLLELMSAILQKKRITELLGPAAVEPHRINNHQQANPSLFTTATPMQRPLSPRSSSGAAKAASSASTKPPVLDFKHTPAMKLYNDVEDLLKPKLLARFPADDENQIYSYAITVDGLTKIYCSRKFITIFLIGGEEVKQAVDEGIHPMFFWARTILPTDQSIYFDSVVETILTGRSTQASIIAKVVDFEGGEFLAVIQHCMIYEQEGRDCAAAFRCHALPASHHLRPVNLPTSGDEDDDDSNTSDCSGEESDEEDDGDEEGDVLKKKKAKHKFITTKTPTQGGGEGRRGGKRTSATKRKRGDEKDRKAEDESEQHRCSSSGSGGGGGGAAASASKKETAAVKLEPRVDTLLRTRAARLCVGDPNEWEQEQQHLGQQKR